MITTAIVKPTISISAIRTGHSRTDAEFIFLIDCLKSFLSQNSDNILNKKLSEKELASMNWHQLEQLTYSHRLLPVVHQRLQDNNLIQAIPSQTAQALANKKQQMVRRNLSLSINTLKLLKSFHLSGIRALPLKGSLLGLQVYNNLALRTPGDIDLLVEPAQSDRILDLLETLGYHWPLAKEWTPTQQKLYIAQQGEVSCISKENGISLDLHFRWSGNAQLFTLPFEQAWQRATLLKVSEAHSPRVLCLEHQLLYLSVHGAKHEWERLSWLLDIAMLIQQPINWEIVRTEAKQLGIQRPVSQALALVHELFEIDIPEAWSTDGWMERDCVSINWLASIAQTSLQNNRLKPATSHLSRPPVAPSVMLRQLRYRMKLKPNMLYKLTCLWRLLLSPKDWQVLDLPEPLWFLYVLLRPVFYVWRAIRV